MPHLNSFSGFGGSPNQIGLDFLEDADPRALFSARTNQLARTPSQLERLNALFGDIFNQFQGVQGRQVLEGGLPTATFNDFLNGQFAEFGGISDFSHRQTPTQRGQSTGRFAPPLRFLRPGR